MPPITPVPHPPGRARLRLPGPAQPSTRGKQIMSLFWATRATGPLRAALPRGCRALAAVTALALATGAAAAASASPATISYRVTTIPAGDCPTGLDANPVTGRVYETDIC